MSLLRIAAFLFLDLNQLKSFECLIEYILYCRMLLYLNHRNRVTYCIVECYCTCIIEIEYTPVMPEGEKHWGCQ